VRVDLGIKFPAGVVMIDRQDRVPCDAIHIRVLLPDTAGRIHFKFFHDLRNCFFVCRQQPVVAARNRHDGNRLWCRDREVVKVAGLRESRTIRDPVRAMPLP